MQPKIYGSIAQLDSLAQLYFCPQNSLAIQLRAICYLANRQYSQKILTIQPEKFGYLADSSIAKFFRQYSQGAIQLENSLRSQYVFFFIRNYIFIISHNLPHQLEEIITACKQPLYLALDSRDNKRKWKDLSQVSLSVDNWPIGHGLLTILTIHHLLNLFCNKILTILHLLDFLQ